MKKLKYSFIFLLALSLGSCTSSILGDEEDDPIVKPPPPPPPPLGYVMPTGATVGMYA